MSRAWLYFMPLTLQGDIYLLLQELISWVDTILRSEVPSNLVLKKVSPRIWLPFLTFWWGLLAMCLGFVRGYGSFLAVRALLGLAEGGLLPGMVRPDTLSNGA